MTSTDPTNGEPQRVSWYGPDPTPGREPAEELRPKTYERQFLGSRRWQDWLLKRTRPKVALVGYADGSRSVPWGDESFEIWGCNDLPQRFEATMMSARFDRAFQWHSDHDRMRVVWPEWDQHLAWLAQTHDYPVYMQAAYANVPSSVRFPKELIEGMVPHGWFFAHSFCWMMAFAAFLGFDEIHLYGAGASMGEPLSAMKCLHYWMGVAEARGSLVVTHGEGELFTIDQIVRSQKQYGYDLTRLVLRHEGPDPASGWFPLTPTADGSPDKWPELDERHVTPYMTTDAALAAATAQMVDVAGTSTSGAPDEPTTGELPEEEDA